MPVKPTETEFSRPRTISEISMAPPYQISDWYGGRHTCDTASGATVALTPSVQAHVNQMNASQCAILTVKVSNI